MTSVTSIKKSLRLEQAILTAIWEDKGYEKLQTPNLDACKWKL